MVKEVTEVTEVTEVKEVKEETGADESNTNLPNKEEKVRGRH